MIESCQLLNKNFVKYAGKSVLLCDERSWTYTELLIEGWRRVKYWQSLGLTKGTRVLLYSPNNRLEYLFSVLACSLGGYEAVSVSQKASSSEVRHICEVTQPDLEWGNIRVDLPTEINIIDASFENVNVIFFTSGTSSLPKGVCHDFATLLANAHSFNQKAELDVGVKMIHVMPTGYMAGLLNTFLSPLMAGGSVVLGDAFDVKSALSFWKLVRDRNVNSMWLTPSMVAALGPLCKGAETQSWMRSNLRHVFVGTAPLHAATREAFYNHVGVNCLESYGMTECMFVSVKPAAVPGLEGSVGLTLAGVEIEVRDSFGAALSPNQEGNIWVHSNYALLGYLDADNLRPALDLEEEGWFDTGDIGRVNVDGFLFITGRRKDLIIHGGTNVSPKQVEDVLLKYTGVKDAAVIGVSHPFWVEEVLAFLIPEPGILLEEKALNIFCGQHLNPDAIPSRFICVDSFPKSSNGKVQKHVLRQNTYN